MRQLDRDSPAWHGEAIFMRAEGVPVGKIARIFGVTRDRVLRVVDPTYADKRAAQIRANRVRNPVRSDRPQRPEIVPTERSVVRELWDGTRVSLPRVRWLERPIPNEAQP